jgi:hypothetical protein
MASGNSAALALIARPFAGWFQQRWFRLQKSMHRKGLILLRPHRVF